MTINSLIPVKPHSQILSDIGNMVAADDGYIVLDVEGNTKDPRADPEHLLLGFSYAYKLNKDLISGYVPINHHFDNVSESTINTFRIIMRDCQHLKPICHNIKYDGVVFKKRLGVDILSKDFYDTMLMAHMVDENLPSKALDYVSKAYGGKPKNKTDAQAKLAEAFGWELIPTNLMYDYSTNDAIITYELFEKLLKKFNQQFDNKLWETERDWVRFIVAVEACGVSLDHEFINEEIKFGEERLSEQKSILGGNPGSPKFLSTLLFERLGLPVVKTSPKTGKPSFDKEAMAKYEEMLENRTKFDEIVEVQGLQETKDTSVQDTARRILEYRGWQKTVSSNYRAYLELESTDKRLRPNYKIHGTSSSRLSCEKPNLQQIPRESENRWNGHLKKAFVPKEGYKLWEFDYSNLELRIMAIYAEQENLLEALRKGFKPFDVMAEQVGMVRQDVKQLAYMTGYGAGIGRISSFFGVSESQARQMREQFFAQYPKFRIFSQNAGARAAKRGYVRMWTGRRRHFPQMKNEFGENIRMGSHKAMNSIVQGGAAELVKYAGIELGKRIDWKDCTINLQIHDSYATEIKIGTEDYWIPVIKETMENVEAYCPEFGVCPFPVEVKEWGRE